VRNFISKRTAERLGLTPIDLPKPVEVSWGQARTTTTYYRLLWRPQHGQARVIDALPLEGLGVDLLIGLRSLADSKAIIDCTTGEVRHKFSGQVLLTAPNRRASGATPHHVAAHNAAEVRIAPGAYAVLEVHADETRPGDWTALFTGDAEALNGLADLRLPATVAVHTDGRGHVLAHNRDPHRELVIAAGTHLGTLSDARDATLDEQDSVRVHRVSTEHTANLPEGKFRFRMEQHGPGGRERSKSEQRIDGLSALKEAHISEAVRCQGRKDIRRVLQKHATVFRQDWRPGTLGNGTEVLLEVEGPPSNRPQYPHSPPAQAILIEMAREMDRQGITEKCENSEWNSPALLAKKTDGTYRFCIDLRGVNKQAKHISFPMPSVQTTLTKLRGCHWYSTFDAKSAFFQVLLHECCRDVTAFTLPDGRRRFRALPMGFTASTQILMQMMMRFVGDLDFVTVHVDDFVVYTRSEKLHDHVQHLETFLQRMEENGVCLSAKKSHVAYDKVRYLGYVVGRGEVEADPEKIAALERWTKLESKADVRSFLGMTNWLAHMIPNYAERCRPLNAQLTKYHRDADGNKHLKRFSWEECRRAFEDLKQAIANMDALAQPDYRREFHVYSDGSTKALGAVLAQPDQEGRPRVVAYASRSLRQNEKGYAPIRFELLAMKWALCEAFRPYLHGCPSKVVVFTDNKPLAYMAEARDNNVTIARWAVELKEVDFETRHIKGELNPADSLSRIGHHFGERDQHESLHLTRTRSARQKLQQRAQAGDTDAQRELEDRRDQEREAKRRSRQHQREANGQPPPRKTTPSVNTARAQLRQRAEAGDELAQQQLEQLRARDTEAQRRSRQRRKKRGTRAMADEAAETPPPTAETPPPTVDASQPDAANPPPPAPTGQPGEDEQHDSEDPEANHNEEDPANAEEHYRSRLADMDEEERHAEHELAHGVEQLIQEQQQDPEAKRVIDHLTGSKRDRHKRIRSLASQAELHEGLLYVHPNAPPSKRSEETRRLWAPKSLRADIVSLAHHVMGHMHEATLQRLRARWFWPGIAADVRQHVRACARCQRRDRHRGPPHGLAGEIVAHEPGKQWHIDYLGPFNETKRGNKYMCSIVDRASRYCTVYATKRSDSGTAIACLRSVIAWLGVPDSVRSDAAKCFTSAQYRNFLRRLHIRPETGSPYHQSSNGVCERRNSDIYRIVGKWVSTYQTDWDEHIDLLNGVLRNMYHSALKNTPNYILLGLEPRLPGEPPLVTDRPTHSRPLSERDRRLSKARELALQELREHSLAQQQERNEHRQQGPEYAPGDQVLVHIGNSLLGEASKFADRYVGPLTVSRPHGASHYALIGKDGREYKARKEEIKRYLPEQEDSSQSLVSIRELHEALAEPESTSAEVTDLPHINPTFANHVSVDHVDPAVTEDTAGSGGTVRSTATSGINSRQEGLWTKLRFSLSSLFSLSNTKLSH